MAEAKPHLYALVVAALETGCRKGELLTMQWHQIRWDQNLVFLPDDSTKTQTARVVPMSVRLKGYPGDAPNRSRWTNVSGRRLRVRERDR